MPLLKKDYDQEKGIEKAIYDSSNILASVYDENKQEMEIIFYKEKTMATGVGDSYTYKQVLPADYVWFRTQDSQGSILFSYVKKKEFPFINNGKCPIHELLVEKNELLKENKNGNKK